MDIVFQIKEGAQHDFHISKDLVPYGTEKMIENS